MRMVDVTAKLEIAVDRDGWSIIAEVTKGLKSL